MKMSNANIIKSFIIITCMLLTACGKADDIVTDYGVMTDNSGQSDNGDKGTELTGGHALSTKGKTVREMVGCDKLEFEDRMDINGMPVYIDIKSSVIDVPALGVYQVNRVSGGRKEEDGIVTNLFGDTAVKLEEIPSSMTNINTGSPITDAYYNVICDFDLGNEDETHVAQDIKMKWIDGDERYIHLYQGKYEGIDFILLYGYSDISKMRTIMFTPVSVGDYLSDRGYDAVVVYNREENKSAEKIFLENAENRLPYSQKDLVDEGSSFLRDKLGVNVYDGMISADSTVLGTGFGGKEELVFVNSDIYDSIWNEHTVKMDDAYSEQGTWGFDIGVRDIENTVANTGLFDGYELFFPNKFSGVPYVDISEEDIYNSYLLITSKGVMTVLFSQKYEVTDVVDDVQILDVDKIKESFKAVLIDAVDEMELDGMKQLIFDDMILRYYPVQNPSDENEYTYIPAWEFSTKWDIRNRGDKTFYVYLNAIDGTLMGVKHN